MRWSRTQINDAVSQASSSCQHWEVAILGWDCANGGYVCWVIN